MGRIEYVVKVRLVVIRVVCRSGVIMVGIFEDCFGLVGRYWDCFLVCG